MGVDNDIAVVKLKVRVERGGGWDEIRVGLMQLFFRSSLDPEHVNNSSHVVL